MGTRSRVGIMHQGVCKSVYCHYDGYLDYTGLILAKYYDQDRTIDMISRGDNSGVQPTVSEMNFYSDRGETGVEWKFANTFEEFLSQVNGCGAEYYYIMQDGIWYAGCVYEVKGLVKNGLVLLADVIADLLIKEGTADTETLKD